MNGIEARIHSLKQYVPELTAPIDLEAFWEDNEKYNYYKLRKSSSELMA
ncbi:hypothetical protein [Paenibacillus plantarum]|nr:hypothetical protein [Paenibacillus plantarum]